MTRGSALSSLRPTYWAITTSGGSLALNSKCSFPDIPSTLMGFFTMQRREVLKLFLVAPMAAAAQYGLRPVSALSVRGVDRLVPKQGTLQIFSGVMPATPAIVGLDNVLIAEAPFSDGDETELIAQVTGTATYMRVLDEGGFGIIQGPIKWAGSSAINMANVINLKVSICNDI